MQGFATVGQAASRALYRVALPAEVGSLIIVSAVVIALKSRPWILALNM